jgi:hypothetical protein
METFWVVVILISSPVDTHVMTERRRHYASEQECLVAAGETALIYAHQMYVAAKCEARLGAAMPLNPKHGTPRDPARTLTREEICGLDAMPITCRRH